MLKVYPATKVTGYVYGVLDREIDIQSHLEVLSASTESYELLWDLSGVTLLTVLSLSLWSQGYVLVGRFHLGGISPVHLPNHVSSIILTAIIVHIQWQMTPGDYFCANLGNLPI